ncbi:thiol:disulfide interchange protein TlpA [Gellertiella hungarica]|uniref:Thiol-disulfide isomerase/thioredoxin n=1 Tax=Gellertiella hungarica TaxID=1572859 RepID=A0A7W6J5E5_9HYPH|nr:TlpA disulfide reductase family protein [Gellertiella hungarica]MBB4065115.1 thiol-disulfide isomerase/thioredoxin [Gellertiella hungarica]
MTVKKPLGLPPVLLIAAALVAGGLAGVAAVYVNGAGSGNAGQASGGTVASASQCQIPPARKAAFAAAAKGAVAAMTPLDPPRLLDGVGFKSPDGKDLTLKDFAGKTVLLNLWATWCFPCREEMPALDRLENLAGGNAFEVVAVNIDTGSDEKPKAFLTETGIKHLKSYRDSSMGIFNALKKEGLALGLPVSLLIDEKGCVLGSMNGPAAWDGPEARALIEAAGS